MGEQLGRYEIVCELGHGAMGRVYKAIDPLIDRPVALKTINLEAAKADRSEYEMRFYQEARAAGQLSHHNIVTIYDIGTSGDIVYIAMEFVQGRELRIMLDETPVLPLGQTLEILSQLTEGLAYAHRRSIVHRDMKPSNVMVTGDGHVKIMDFGIARMTSSAVHTKTGMLLGSPQYMSPEQVMGKTLDQRSDIFSLGVIGYEMLVGKPPFTGQSIDEIMHQTLHTAPPPPSIMNPGIPATLDLIMAKAMAKRVDDRYQSASELAGDLDRFRTDFPDFTWTPASAPPPAQAPTEQQAPAISAAIENEAGGPPASLGVSLLFDSLAATTRMAAQTYEGSELQAFTAGLAPQGPEAQTENAGRQQMHADTQKTKHSVQVSGASKGTCPACPRKSRRFLRIAVPILVCIVIAVFWYRSSH